MTEPIQQPDIKTREGFAQMAAPLQRLLLSVSYGVLRDWDLAADAAQNALLKAWRHRRSLKNPANFKAWLVQITLNESKNLMRKAVDLPLDLELPQTGKDNAVSLDVERAVLSLEEIYRLPIWLFYFEDMSVADICIALHLPKGTVVSRLHRGREILKKELKEYDIHGC